MSINIHMLKHLSKLNKYYSTKTTNQLIEVIQYEPTNFKKIQEILKSGVNPNNQYDQNLPLNEAVRALYNFPCKNTIKLLLDNGANPNNSINKYSPIGIMCGTTNCLSPYIYKDVVDVLVRNGARITIDDIDNATGNRHQELVLILLHYAEKQGTNVMNIQFKRWNIETKIYESKNIVEIAIDAKNYNLAITLANIYVNCYVERKKYFKIISEQILNDVEDRDSDRSSRKIYLGEKY